MPLDNKAAERLLRVATQRNEMDRNCKRVVPTLLVPLDMLIAIVRDCEGVPHGYLTGPVEAAQLAEGTFRSTATFCDTLEQKILKRDGVILRGVGVVTANPSQAVYLDRDKIADIAKGRDPKSG